MKILKRSFIFSLVIILSIFYGCRSGAQVPTDTVITVITPTVIPIECKNDLYPSDAPQFGENYEIDYKTLQENLKIFDLNLGEGEKEVISEDRVEVHYTGWLIDGCVFDSTYPRRETAKFRIGRNQVIKGWDLGIPGMKIGGIRRLEIGSELAYGKDGIPGVIPENASLVFEVKLIDIKRLVNNE